MAVKQVYFPPKQPQNLERFYKVGLQVQGSFGREKLLTAESVQLIYIMGSFGIIPDVQIREDIEDNSKMIFLIS